MLAQLPLATIDFTTIIQRIRFDNIVLLATWIAHYVLRQIRPMQQTVGVATTAFDMVQYSLDGYDAPF